MVSIDAFANIAFFLPHPSSDMPNTYTNPNPLMLMYNTFLIINVILNPTKPNERKKKMSRKPKWDISKIYYDWWVVKFNYFEPICVVDGKLKLVKCKIYFQIEKINKLLVLKFNSLIKHFGLKKCIVGKPRVVMGDYFVNLSNFHVKDEKNMGLQGISIFLIN